MSNEYCTKAAIAFFLAVGSALEVSAGQLIVSSLFEPTLEDGRIEIVGTDGTGKKLIREVDGGLRGVIYHADVQNLVWSNIDTDQIVGLSMADILAKPSVVLSEGLAFPQDLDKSAAQRKIFWTDSTLGHLMMADHDGSAATPIFHGITTAIAVDDVNQHVYTENRSTAARGSIVRMNFDGSGSHVVVDDVPTATSIAVDPIRETIFWTSSAGLSSAGGGVYRVNYDGSDFEELFLMGSNLDTSGLALDINNGYIYWGQRTDANRSDIYRMNMDGTAPERISSGYGNISDMVLVEDFPLLPTVVQVDIKPRNERNLVNPRSRGQVWVAVLSDSNRAFDPLQVDLESATFGPNKATSHHHRVVDLNRDGVSDLMLSFSIPDTGIGNSDTKAVFTAETFHGEIVTGVDSVDTGCASSKGCQ